MRVGKSQPDEAQELTIRRAQQGDLAAFNALVLAYHANRVQSLISCQILVPLDWLQCGCGSQDWAYFLVTRTAGRPDPDHDNPCVIQVFLFPAARA